MKRKKVYGIGILCNSNNGKIDYEDIDKDYFVCLAKVIRSHYDSDCVKKKMKLGTVCGPLCVDEEKLDDNSDDENNSGTYEAGNMVKKVRLPKWKGGSRGLNGGNVDDDAMCKAGQTTRSQKRINRPRKGSRDENQQIHAGRCPVKESGFLPWKNMKLSKFLQIPYWTKKKFLLTNKMNHSRIQLFL